VSGNSIASFNSLTNQAPSRGGFGSSGKLPADRFAIATDRS
jgi:hypothetical protein